MAKVIKLKDRQGSVVLPLTRSQLVQVSQITGLDLAEGKNWTSASVQDALNALMSYATTIKESNAGALADINTIKAALEGVLDTQKAVVNKIDEVANAYLNKAKEYTDTQDTTYLNQAKTYTGEQIQALGSTTATNGQYVTAIGVDASGKLTTTTKQVAGTEVSSAAISGQATVDAALSYLKNSVDTAYTNAEQYTDEKVNALKGTLNGTITAESGKVFTSITQTNGVLSYTDAALTSSDITRTATTGAHGVAATTVEGAIQELAAAVDAGGTGSVVTVEEVTTGLDDSILKAYKIWQGPTSEATNLKGTINIPKDLVVTAGSVVNGTWSGDTFTEGSGTDKALKLVIANQTAPVYINPSDFIDEYTGGTNTEVTVAVSGTNEITATIGEIAASKISYNDSNVNTELTNINATLTAHQNDLTSYDARISDLEDAAAALSYTIDANGTSYINVTPSTSNGVTTFTVTTSDIASDTNLQALQTSYNNMNTELTNMGVFYEQVGSNTIADPTLDTFTI